MKENAALAKQAKTHPFAKDAKGWGTRQDEIQEKPPAKSAAATLAVERVCADVRWWSG